MRKANINLPKPNYLHTCDVLSAVLIHVIPNALEARQAAALRVETTILVFFWRLVLLPNRSRDIYEPGYCFLRVMWQGSVFTTEMNLVIILQG